MQRFTELKVWQRAHELTLAVHRETRAFPSDERYGLTAQLRRSAGAVGANIAEGSKSRYPAEYAHSLNIAEKEMAEAENHLLLARDLEYLAAGQATRLLAQADEVGRMLNVLRSRVEAAARGRGDPRP
ncbi:MAG: four helix bundle protein [Deltaproteobacteria bacterium]|nr:four helix bundle protein [Deltaproteobacteria bacterium]